MDALKDIWASLVAGVRDRTTNPLTLSFILSWSLWNYKFFVILFEDAGSAEKLNAIAAMYPHERATYLGEALLYPLASALVYVFVYPVISMAPIGVYRTYQVWTANLIKKIEKSRVLTQAEATALTRRHEKEKAAIEEEMVSHAEELTQLRNALKEAEEQISTLKASTALKQPSANTVETDESDESDETSGLKLPSSAPNPNFSLQTTTIEPHAATVLSKLQTRILLLLSNKAGRMQTKNIAAELSQNLTLVELELKELARSKLVQSHHSPTYGQMWTLSDNGKELAVQLLRPNAR